MITGDPPVASQMYIAPGAARWLPLGGGDELDVISPEGPQVADTWAFNVKDASEYLSMAHCRLHWARARPILGDELVSNRKNVMMVLIEDGSGGMHDTLLPACDASRYVSLGHQGYHRTCAENLAQALAEADLPPCSPDPLNLFECTRVAADGRIEILPPVCPLGGHVRFRALIPLIVIVSACPQDLAPTNGADCRPKPIHLAVRRRLIAVASMVAA